MYLFRECCHTLKPTPSRDPRIRKRLEREEEETQCNKKSNKNIKVYLIVSIYWLIVITKHIYNTTHTQTQTCNEDEEINKFKQIREARGHTSVKYSHNRCGNVRSSNTGINLGKFPRAAANNRQEPIAGQRELKPEVEIYKLLFKRSSND